MEAEKERVTKALSNLIERQSAQPCTSEMVDSLVSAARLILETEPPKKAVGFDTSDS